MKIVVLAGGISTERDVSLSSGSLIYKCLKERGHQAVLLDVFLGYEGTDVVEIFDKEINWAEETKHVSEESPDIEQIKALRPDWKKNFFGPNVISICQAADVVFMGLHGENGENGRIQACFDLMGICYTGTDYVSSALCRVVCRLQDSDSPRDSPEKRKYGGLPEKVEGRGHDLYGRRRRDAAAPCGKSL